MSEWGEWAGYQPPQQQQAQPTVNRTTYVQVPFGNYNVIVKSLKLKPSKKGNPMLCARFMVTEGEYSGQSIFMNQVLVRNAPNDSLTISICNKFLKSLKVFDEKEIVFNNLNDYEDLVSDIEENIADRKYSLRYTENKKGFPVFSLS